MPRSTPQFVAKVLLADGEGAVRDAVAAGLAAAGYGVEVALVDAALDSKVAQGEWDVLVFDIAACDALQSSFDDPAQPIRILLTEDLQPDEAIMALLDFGADACLEKPVHVGVLAATIASLRRRVALVLLPHAAPRRGEEHDVWRLSPTNWTITCPRGNVAKLTRAETDFLLMLGRQPGEAVARDRLIVAMGHHPDYYDPRRLDTFASRMRNKVSGACSASLPLRTVHALGYAFAAPLQLLD